MPVSALNHTPEGSSCSTLTGSTRANQRSSTLKAASRPVVVLVIAGLLPDFALIAAVTADLVLGVGFATVEAALLLLLARCTLIMQRYTSLSSSAVPHTICIGQTELLE